MVTVFVEPAPATVVLVVLFVLFVLALPFELFGLTTTVVAVVLLSATGFYVPCDAKTGEATSTKNSPTATPKLLTCEILTVVFIRLLKGDVLIRF